MRRRIPNPIWDGGYGVFIGAIMWVLIALINCEAGWGCVKRSDDYG